MESGVCALVSNSYAGPFGGLPLAKFLHARGERMFGGSLPPDDLRGARRECFRNAWNLAVSRNMEYWEGHAWDPALGGVPVHHAWCRDASSRKVFEPTWGNGANVIYLGVHVPTSVLTHSLEETRTFGVLDNVAVFNGEVAARYFMSERSENDASTRNHRREVQEAMTRQIK